ncbi:mitotic-spindle organizing protein-like [Raphidocelis subcapitata]|uniref:Mitotic-spindle organizing protein-like n=1 Tax=Raphidocelis subcapitata TaxID=307507 RepID=A0A2V0NS68_9CHLO|nr:mitotic-spindle organizing protein-like [Raphidocelis subcapitata]|eukprot:GBF88393.1 mitotic-spindle organizing protein-like [Raphidocelis subcapitata]
MDAHAKAADQAIDTLHQISNILDTGLDKETLRILVGLCEAGVNPEALAHVVKELRREAALLRAAAADAPPAAGARQ